MEAAAAAAEAAANELQQVAGHSPDGPDAQSSARPDGMNVYDLDAFAQAHNILSEVLKDLSVTPPQSFDSPEAEDEFVRRQVDLRNYLDMLIRSGFLQPTSYVSIEAQDQVPLVVMFRPLANQFKDIQRVPRRYDANLYFNLVSFPDDFIVPHLPREEAELIFKRKTLPERRFLIQASLCRSVLELGQKSNNVGYMQTDEESQKYLLIKNRSEIPLLYSIKKTGFIASGDIRVDDNRYGVVRGYDSRKIVYYFKPSMPGTYNEKIAVYNVLDPEGAQYATLKAIVRRPERFFVQSLKIDFGRCVVDQPSPKPQLIIITNTSNKTRTLIVEKYDGCALTNAAAVGPSPSNPPVASNGVKDNEDDDDRGDISKHKYYLEPRFLEHIDGDTEIPVFLDKETEEELEALEQKLKIAIRKNRPEKIEKLKKKIERLKGGGKTKDPPKEAKAAEQAGEQAGPESRQSPQDASKGDGEGGQERAMPPPVQIKYKEEQAQAIVTIVPNATASIPILVTPRRSAEHDPTAADCNNNNNNEEELAVCCLRVYEQKDMDTTKILLFPHYLTKLTNRLNNRVFRALQAMGEEDEERKKMDEDEL
ncbi:hypothetical protein EV182_004340 [Spiromyces aspiralis]|uniref:Uncharacterized protein n=1 Tax=Spiromyces aspiralis TaxID=68401 RepID=A0ACC1HRB9_9FUNG|nr:hypothetical protein EV182_004340 [Spiromyces aspiralis]